jgi:hypothetical protein
MVEKRGQGRIKAGSILSPCSLEREGCENLEERNSTEELEVKISLLFCTISPVFPYFSPTFPLLYFQFSLLDFPSYYRSKIQLVRSDDCEQKPRTTTEKAPAGAFSEDFC